MTRIIERSQDADAGENLLELRVFPLRACVVPADLTVTFEMLADLSEPAAQAYLDALALCEAEGVATLWVHDPLRSLRRIIHGDHAAYRNGNVNRVPQGLNPMPEFYG